MINALVHRATSVAAIGALVVTLSSGCAGLPSSFRGCSDRDERFATTLADLPILTAHPDGATPMSNESGCDTDDRYAYASQRYQTANSDQPIGWEAAAGRASRSCRGPWAEPLAAGGVSGATRRLVQVSGLGVEPAIDDGIERPLGSDGLPVRRLVAMSRPLS